MVEIKLTKRYPHSREEDITDAFMRGYVKGKADRPQGEWAERTHDTLIAQVNFAYCSECGQPIMHEHTRPLWNFCPNCGAKMKGADDE